MEDESLEAKKEIMISCEGLVKIYKTKDLEVLALQGLDLEVRKGEFMAIIGNSGSGKSTFLNMISGLDKPSAGKLFVDGKNLFAIKEKELVDYKRRIVGFVWQKNSRNLFSYLTALANVEVPLMFLNQKDRKARALELMKMTGIDHKKNCLLSQMSGGEQQRVAIAIALANQPKILLADEPTGAVDEKTASGIMDLFRKLNEELGLTIIIVTHDMNMAKKVGRVVMIRDGKISSERILKENYAERLKETGSLSDVEDTHDEYAILDKAGRVQLTKELLDEIHLKQNQVKIEVENGKIIISNPFEEEEEK